MSQTKGKYSQSKKNGRSSEVTPAEDSNDDVARLPSAVGTPTKDKQQTRQVEKQQDQELQSEVDDLEENADLNDSDVNGKLDAVYEDLMMLKQSGRIPLEDVEDIMKNVDKKLRKRSHELIWLKGSKVEHYAVFASNLCEQRGRSKKKGRNKRGSCNLLAGSEARVLSDIAKVQDLAICHKFLVFHLQKSLL